MANLAASAVTVRETWKEGGTNARKFLAKAVTLNLTGQGGTTNKIPASLFGMSKIWSIRDAVTDDNNILLATPSYDGSYILLLRVGPTAAAVFAPADITDIVRLTVLGKE